MSQYAAQRKKSTSVPVIEYYCFTGPDDPYARERLQKSTFTAQLISIMSDAYPRLFNTVSPSDRGEERLREMIQILSQHALRDGQPAIFIIDGIDAVTRQELAVGDRLTDGLPTALPDGVIFLISAQSREQIPINLAAELNDARRTLTIDRFSLARTHAYVQQRLEADGALEAGWRLLQTVGLRALHQTADGLPLYLRYIVDVWLRTRDPDLDALLGQFPSVDGDISEYYSVLWPTLTSAQSYVLTALASLSFPADAEELASILNEAALDRFAIADAIRHVSHLLRRDGSNGFVIFHDSFRKFVIDRNLNGADEVYKKVYEYLRRDPKSELARTRLFEYALKVGDLEPPIEMCTREYLATQLADGRTPDEIRINVGHALDAAARKRDLVALFRIGLIAYQLLLAEQTMERGSLQKALLNMGREGDAIRYSWDGRNIIGEPKSALRLAADLALKGSTQVAEEITSAAVDELRTDDHLMVDDMAAYYRALATLGKDMKAPWRSLLTTQSGWSQDQREELTTAIIEGLVDARRDDEFRRLRVLKGTSDMRFRLMMAEAEVAANSGSDDRARALIEEFVTGARRKLSPNDARSAAAALVRFDGSRNAIKQLTERDPMTIPTREELDYSRGADVLDRFYQQLRVRCFLGDQDSIRQAAQALGTNESQ